MLSKRKFKKIIEQAVNKKFLENMLTSRKRKLHGVQKTVKIDRKSYRIQTQSYLTTNRLSQKEKQTLFMLRVQNVNIKSNFKGSLEDDNMKCRICEDEDSFEDENHLLNCSELTSHLEESDVDFDSVFGDLEMQISATKRFMKVLSRRKTIMELRGIH